MLKFTITRDSPYNKLFTVYFVVISIKSDGLIDHAFEDVAVDWLVFFPKYMYCQLYLILEIVGPIIMTLLHKD